MNHLLWTWCVCGALPLRRHVRLNTGRDSLIWWSLVQNHGTDTPVQTLWESRGGGMKKKITSESKEDKKELKDVKQKQWEFTSNANKNTPFKKQQACDDVILLWIITLEKIFHKLTNGPGDFFLSSTSAGSDCVDTRSLSLLSYYDCDTASRFLYLMCFRMFI